MQDMISYNSKSVLEWVDRARPKKKDEFEKIKNENVDAKKKNWKKVIQMIKTPEKSLTLTLRFWTKTKTSFILDG